VDACKPLPVVLLTMPESASTISRNCPMTSGTAWIRFTSSCARSSSILRFFCSSLMQGLTLARFFDST